MKHFIDELLERKYDLRQEIVNIETLFLERYDGYSIYDKFNTVFIDWNLRNNYISFDDFFSHTGLEKIVEKCYNHCDISLEEFLYYCEYMINVLFVPKILSCRYSKAIIENIINVIHKLNYKLHETEKFIRIIQNDVVISEAADVVQSNYDLGEGIYAFNYRETKGDLIKKSDIICRLYKYIESISPQAKQYGYTNLMDDIKDLSNKLDIRHAPTSKQDLVIKGMNATEYEDWVDEVFRLSLTLILLVDYTSKRKDIKELKSKLG